MGPAVRAFCIENRCRTNPLYACGPAHEREGGSVTQEVHGGPMRGDPVAADCRPGHTQDYACVEVVAAPGMAAPVWTARLARSAQKQCLT